MTAATGNDVLSLRGVKQEPAFSRISLQALRAIASLNGMRNDSERVVAELCNATFLSLWSYPNPIGKGGKELCDVLIVCDPDVVIFSVKKIELKGDPENPVQSSRWRRAAVDESVKQIYGAERWIKDAKVVVRSDGTTAIPFPDLVGRRVHRIAVALGGKRQVQFESGDKGKGFVHVLDEQSLHVLMSELDTIEDFLGYLRHKETFLRERREITIEGGEEDLLAFYVLQQGSFPSEPHALFLGAGGWEDLAANPYYRSRAKADEVSYNWDRLIDVVAKSIGITVERHTNISIDTERSIRVMAREDRLSRRVLAERLVDLLTAPMSGTSKARLVDAPRSKVRYVFIGTSTETERVIRATMLQGYCLVARLLAGTPVDVVGLATSADGPGADQSVDLAYLAPEMWDAEREAEAKWLMAKGVGRNFVLFRSTTYQYPAAVEKS